MKQIGYGRFLENNLIQNTSLWFLGVAVKVFFENMQSLGILSCIEPV